MRLNFVIFARNRTALCSVEGGGFGPGAWVKRQRTKQAEDKGIRGQGRVTGGAAVGGGGMGRPGMETHWGHAGACRQGGSQVLPVALRLAALWSSMPGDLGPLLQT